MPRLVIKKAVITEVVDTYLDEVDPRLSFVLCIVQMVDGLLLPCRILVHDLGSVCGYLVGKPVIMGGDYSYQEEAGADILTVDVHDICVLHAADGVGIGVQMMQNAQTQHSTQ